MEKRSEEIREIIGAPPPFLIRWGMILSLFVVVVLGWGAYFFKYPDTITTDILVTSKEPSFKLVAQKSAFVESVEVENEDKVVAGQILVALASKANFADVLVLDDLIYNIDETNTDTLLHLDLPSDLLLGDLKEYWYDFREKQDLIFLTQQRDAENVSISRLTKQLKKARVAIDYEKKDKINLETKHQIAKERYIREDNLLKEGLSTVAKVRTRKDELLATERSLQEVEANIKAKQFEIRIIQKDISAYKTGSAITNSNAFDELKRAFKQLREEIEEWKQEFLIMAPADGIVLIQDRNLAEHQFVARESELMVVLPTVTTGIIGHIDLDLKGSGKIKVGQKVIIKLNSYPFEVFGAVEGQIAKKGKVPRGDIIPVQIEFPKGLETNSGKILEQTREMYGKAHIVVEEKRFIEWVFERFKKWTL